MRLQKETMTPEEIKSVETAGKAVHALRSRHKDKFKPEHDFKLFLDYKGTFVQMYAHAKYNNKGIVSNLHQADVDKPDAILKMIQNLESDVAAMAAEVNKPIDEHQP
jgi:hypothetical protein